MSCYLQTTVDHRHFYQGKIQILYAFQTQKIADIFMYFKDAT